MWRSGVGGVEGGRQSERRLGELHRSRHPSQPFPHTDHKRTAARDEEACAPWDQPWGQPSRRANVSHSRGPSTLTPLHVTGGELAGNRSHFAARAGRQGRKRGADWVARRDGRTMRACGSGGRRDAERDGTEWMKMSNETAVRLYGRRQE